MANVKTPHFRVSYPSVFKAKLNKMNGREEYSLVALFPKGTDLSALKAEAQRAIEEEWGNKPPKGLRSPFRKMEEKQNEDGSFPAGLEAGGIFINLKSKNRPGLVNERREAIIDETEFYAGCWAHCTVRAYAYEVTGNAGVSFGLQNIQKVKDGDPLSGRAKAEDEFAPIEGAVANGSAESLFD